MGCTSSTPDAASTPANGNKKPSTLPNNPKAPTEPPSSSSSSTAITASSLASEHKFSNLYTLGDKLGEGTYSVVRIGYRIADNTKVAVKIVTKTGTSPEDQQNLLREIQILKSISHPNIVNFIDFFEESEKYFVVLEYLAGGELFERLTEKTYFNENEARDIALVLFQAIKYLHDHGIVHRDIKPENILLVAKDNDKDMKLADFGFAARIGTGTIKQQAGTPGYVSPEVLERKPHGKPVDMWAMGVVLYMLLGGYPPFYQNDDDPRAMYRRILLGNYQFHPEYWSEISPEAKDLITGLLTVDQTARLTVDQVLQHPWLKKSKEELSLVSLDRNLGMLREFRAARAAKVAAMATTIAIDVARKFSGANLSRTNILNEVAVDVIRKISNSNLNEIALEARRRQSANPQAQSNPASQSASSRSPNTSTRI